MKKEKKNPFAAQQSSTMLKSRQSHYFIAALEHTPPAA